MGQFFKEKFNLKLSKKHTDSLNLPVQRCESQISAGPTYHDYHHNDDIQSTYDSNPYQFYNKRAKETQSMTTNHQQYQPLEFDAPTRMLMINDNDIRGSKTENHTNDHPDEEEGEDNRYHCSKKRKDQNRLRSTIMSLLPASKRKSQSSDCVYLISKNIDLESNHQDQEKPKKKVTFFKTPPPPASPMPAYHPNFFSKPSPPSSEQPKPMLVPPMSPSYRRQPRFFPFFSYLFAIGTFVLLIYDIFLFKKDYGTIINLSPFNIMLGPNTETFIQSGALFAPCIRAVQTSFQCTPKTGQPSTLTPPTWSFFLNKETGNGTDSCSINDLCGLVSTSSSDKTAHPAQFYRFITAIAVHGGIIQWVINITVLLTFGASTERSANSFRFAFVWIVSGAFGYALASLFLKENAALMGCFGSLHGIFSLALIDLYQTRHFHSNASAFLFKLLMLIVLGGILGYLPGYSNFSHIGGLIAGILSGVVVVRTSLQFRVNKLLWFLLLLIRLLALSVLAVLFYLIFSKFYSNQNMIDNCTWCGYISCLPIFNMCSSR